MLLDFDFTLAILLCLHPLWPRKTGTAIPRHLSVAAVPLSLSSMLPSFSFPHALLIIMLSSFAHSSLSQIPIESQAGLKISSVSCWVIATIHLFVLPAWLPAFFSFLFLPFFFLFKKFLSFLSVVFIYLMCYVLGGRYVHAVVLAWRSEDNLWELSFSDNMWALELTLDGQVCQQALYSVSHLTDFFVLDLCIFLLVSSS